MVALTENKKRVEKKGELQAMPVGAGEVIYQGAMVKIGADGYIAPCSAEAGAVYAGIAYEACDNSAGVDGEKSVRVELVNSFVLQGSGFTQADLGKSVFAQDDTTVSLTDAGNEQEVGKIIEVLSATEVLVKPNPNRTK
jgi:hypothetical protein